ncbi:MAG: hypothetical protein WDN00_16130 [Limisphaerales bacterium]
MNTQRTFRLKRPIVPRKIIIITMLFWTLLLAFFWAVLHQPKGALIPLYGLYPGETASDFSNHAGQIWATSSGLVFAGLAVVGFFWKSKVAAIAFMVLFFISTAGWLLRFH